MYSKLMTHYQSLPPQALERSMRQAKAHLDPQAGQQNKIPWQVQQAHLGNQEKSYKNWLKVQASNLWRKELTILTLPRHPDAYKRMSGLMPATLAGSVCTSQPPT